MPISLDSYGLGSPISSAIYSDKPLVDEPTSDLEVRKFEAYTTNYHSQPVCQVPSKGMCTTRLVGTSFQYRTKESRRRQITQLAGADRFERTRIVICKQRASVLSAPSYQEARQEVCN